MENLVLFCYDMLYSVKTVVFFFAMLDFIEENLLGATVEVSEQMPVDDLLYDCMYRLVLLCAGGVRN